MSARSREWQSHSVNYQRGDLRESPMCRRRPWNIWHAKYLDLSPIQNPAVWMSWLKNTSVMTYNQWEPIFLFYFFTKQITLAIYKQRAYIFALEYTEQVSYMKMKKGLGFFL